MKDRKEKSGRITWSRLLLASLAMFGILAAGPALSAPEPGTITIVSPGEPPDLDPGNFDFRLTGRVIRQNVNETLMILNLEDSSLTPRLATEWKEIDPQTWQFTLRKGVKFHDGEDFDAAAFKYSIDRLYNRNIASVIRSKFFEHLTLEVEAIDDHTVIVRADKPEPLMFTRMAQVPMVSPNTPMDKLVREPVGTGPYKFVKWDAGVQIVLERFDGYWGEKPPVQKAVYIWRGESSVRAHMVEIGEADFCSSIDPQLATNPKTDVAYLNFETLYGIIGAFGGAPLDDQRVRLALQYAIDREAIRGSILPKEAIPAVAVVVPGVFGHNPNLKPYPYDPEKARSLLEEAKKDGVPVEKEIKVIQIADNYAYANEVIEAVTSMLQAAGFNVKMMLVESGQYRKYRDKPRIDAGPVILLAQHDNDKGDAGFSVLNRYHSESPRNPIADPKIDELIDKGMIATGEERRQIFQELFRYLHEEVNVDLLLFHQVAYARINPRINYDVQGKNDSNFYLEQVTFN